MYLVKATQNDVKAASTRLHCGMESMLVEIEDCGKCFSVEFLRKKDTKNWAGVVDWKLNDVQVFKPRTMADAFFEPLI